MAFRVFFVLALLASPLSAEQTRVLPSLGGTATENVLDHISIKPSSTRVSWGTWGPGCCFEGEGYRGYVAYDLPASPQMVELVVKTTSVAANAMPTVVLAPPLSRDDVDHASDSRDIWDALAHGQELGRGSPIVRDQRYASFSLDSAWLAGKSDVLLSLVSGAPPGFPATSQPLPFLLIDFSVIPGDANHDNRLDNLDIAPFSQALIATNEERLALELAYETKAGLPWRSVWLDVNGNGQVNNLDIAPFAAALTQGAPVPEPAGWLLALLALCCLLLAHRSTV